MSDDLEAIFASPLPLGTRPRRLAWSPTRDELGFFWDQAATDKLGVYVLTDDGLTDVAPGVDGFTWSSTGDLIVWQGTTVWRTGSPTQRIDCAATVTGVQDNGDMCVAFTETNVLTVDWGQGSARPLVEPDRPGRSIGQVEWSDGDLIIVRPPRDYQRLAHAGARFAIVTLSNPRHHLAIADFLSDPVSPVVQTHHRSGDYTVSVIADGQVTWRYELPPLARLYNLSWSADDTAVLLDFVLADRTTRVITVLDTSTWQLTELHRETSDGWFGPLPLTAEWSPDGRRILIGSERSGFNHLAVVSLDGIRREITSGQFEVKDAYWTSASQLAAITSESDPAQHSVWLIDAGTSERRRVSDPEFLCTDLAVRGQSVAAVTSRATESWSVSTVRAGTTTDGESLCRALAFPVHKTDPELLVPEPSIIDLADHSFERHLRATTYVPVAPNGAGIIFVHGNGYLQDVMNGQSPYYWREHLFNRMLARRGYHVISVDYAGSEGYGKQFAQLPLHALPGPELEDIGRAHAWLVDQGCDPSRTGAYGGSYGGYLVAAELLRANSILACGAALRTVTDWAAYVESDSHFTYQRLDTDVTSQGYSQSTLLGKGARLAAPLLLLHGLVDDNVPVSHIIKLLEEIQAAGRGSLVELMVYPPEGHGFRRPERWLDEYTRVFTFFARNLRE